MTRYKYACKSVKLHGFQCFEVTLYLDNCPREVTYFNSEAACITWATKRAQKGEDKSTQVSRHAAD